MSTDDPEIDAIATIQAALDGLPADSRARALAWAGDRFAPDRSSIIPTLVLMTNATAEIVGAVRKHKAGRADEATELDRQLYDAVEAAYGGVLAPADRITPLERSVAKREFPGQRPKPARAGAAQ